MIFPPVLGPIWPPQTRFQFRGWSNDNSTILSAFHSERSLVYSFVPSETPNNASSPPSCSPTWWASARCRNVTRRSRWSYCCVSQLPYPAEDACQDCQPSKLFTLPRRKTSEQKEFESQKTRFPSLSRRSSARKRRAPETVNISSTSVCDRDRARILVLAARMSPAVAIVEMRL